MGNHGMPGMTPEQYREMKAKRANAVKRKRERNK